MRAGGQGGSSVADPAAPPVSAGCGSAFSRPTLHSALPGYRVQVSMEIPASESRRSPLMRAHINPASPFARKVRIVLRERNLTGQIEEIETAVSPVAPNADLARANPLVK